MAPDRRMRHPGSFLAFTCRSNGRIVLLRPQRGHFLSDPVNGGLRQLIRYPQSQSNPYELPTLLPRPLIVRIMNAYFWIPSRFHSSSRSVGTSEKFSQSQTACLRTWRLISLLDSVRGMLFGQTLTQFCALSQS